LRVPILQIVNSHILLLTLRNLLPEIVAFIISFFIITIYWVNHHYFFHGVERTDWKLLWYNNHHLYWMATIPFTTALIGAYHTQPVAILVYCLDMVMSAVSIMLMIQYVFFHSKLMRLGFSEERKRKEFRRGMLGVYLYIIATLTIFINVYLTLTILIITPILFVVPRLMSGEEMM